MQFRIKWKKKKFGSIYEVFSLLHKSKGEKYYWGVLLVVLFYRKEHEKIYKFSTLVFCVMDTETLKTIFLSLLRLWTNHENNFKTYHSEICIYLLLLSCRCLQISCPEYLKWLYWLQTHAHHSSKYYFQKLTLSSEILVSILNKWYLNYLMDLNYYYFPWICST